MADVQIEFFEETGTKIKATDVDYTGWPDQPGEIGFDLRDDQSVTTTGNYSPAKLNMDEDADEDVDSGTSSTTALTTEGTPGSVVVGHANTDEISGVTDTSGVTATRGIPSGVIIMATGNSVALATSPPGTQSSSADQDITLYKGEQSDKSASKAVGFA